MVQKHIQEQVELLLEHLHYGSPDPQFIERHAFAIAELANDINFYAEPLLTVHEPKLWLCAS